MGYIGNEPADVAVQVGSDVITSTEIQDASIATADIANDAITANKVDDDGTGFQMGSLGLGTAVSGSHKLTVGGTATFSGDITGTLATASQTNITSVGALSSLHVQTASAGSVTANGNADNLVVETNGTGGISILTPDASHGYLMFGSPTSNEGAILRYKDGDNVFTVGTEDSNGSMVLRTGAGTTALTIDSSQNSIFAGTISSSTSSTTDSVLTLTDAGVADYNWTFPDTSTIKMSTNTSSSKVFELKNEGSGFFNLKVEGEIEIQASSDPAIKFNSAEAGADAWYIYSAGSGLKFRNLDDSVTAFELTHSNNASLSGSLYMAGGSTGRILFNSQRAMEGTTNNTLLSLGEDYVDVRVRANCIPDGNNTRNLGSTSYRWSVLYTSNSVNVSDRTTKTEIADCDLGTDFINTLQPKSYKMADLPEEHDDYSRKHYGLIAQDLINTDLNDSVFGEQDGEYSLAYNDLIAPMIKAIQELSAEVEKLKGN